MGLRDLYARYKDHVQFVVIYIRGTHAVREWALDGPDLHEPKTIEERRQAAERCQEGLLYGMPTVVDESDNAVMRAYAAWPNRLVLVGLDGRVAYVSGEGPYGFRPAELKEAIDDLLATQGGVGDD